MGLDSGRIRSKHFQQPSTSGSGHYGVTEVLLWVLCAHVATDFFSPAKRIRRALGRVAVKRLDYLMISLKKPDERFISVLVLDTGHQSAGCIFWEAHMVQVAFGMTMSASQVTGNIAYREGISTSEAISLQSLAVDSEGHG